MAFQAEIDVTLGKQLFVDRAMYVVAVCAAFSQRLMLEDMRAGLLAMTLPTGFILSRNENSFWVVDVLAMGIVTIGAAHHAFPDGMMILKIK